jgi:hypothetical protein
VYDLAGIQPVHAVPGDSRHRRRVVDDANRVAGILVVENRVVADCQAARGVEIAFLAIGNDDGVLRVRAFFDDVAGDGGVAAVRQVDVVAGGAGRAVLNPVVLNDGVSRTALDFVADDGAGEVAVFDGQRADVVDIQIVGVTAAVAIVRELGVVDRDVAVGIVGGEQTLLIVVEVVIVQTERAAFVAYASAVVVRYSSAGEGKIVDRDSNTGGTDIQNRFAVGRRLVATMFTMPPTPWSVRSCVMPVGKSFV